MNRDIRFSNDKTPYKDHMDLWVWEGQRKTALSGFFLRIRGKSVHLGAGPHGFSKQRGRRGSSASQRSLGQRRAQTADRAGERQIRIILCSRVEEARSAASMAHGLRSVAVLTDLRSDLLVLLRLWAMSHLRSLETIAVGFAGLVGPPLPWQDHVRDQVKRAGTKA